ncbi:MAG TPA: hypothetical protein VJB99_03615 [Patescibacteria group bacterium]|nr:hypothetical protein [Patescibacteria group bacterium]
MSEWKEIDFLGSFSEKNEPEPEFKKEKEEELNKIISILASLRENSFHQQAVDFLNSLSTPIKKDSSDPSLDRIRERRWYGVESPFAVGISNVPGSEDQQPELVIELLDSKEKPVGSVRNLLLLDRRLVNQDGLIACARSLANGGVKASELETFLEAVRSFKKSTGA